MTKPTATPWFIKHPEGMPLTLYGVASNGTNWERIASIHNPVSSSRTDANAALLVAAPELKAMLELARDLLLSLGYSGPVLDEISAVLKKTECEE